MKGEGRESGFTLLEMTLVVAAIGLLTAIALPNILMAREKAKEVVCRANRHTLERLEQLFAQEHGRYSYSVAELMASEYYANQKGCPKGGVYFWVDFPQNSPLYHSIVGCSVHGIDTTQEQNKRIFPVVLFSSDFNDPSQWRVVRGRWTIRNGVAHAGPRGENRAFAGDESWTNYVVAADARIIRGKGLGIYFRATDVKRVDGYIFQVDPGYGRGYFLFRKLRNGRETRPFARARPPKGFDWYAPHHIEIKVENDVFTAYVDGKEVLKSADDEYTHGMIGMRTWWRAEAEFTNIEVREPDKNKK